MRIDVGKKSYLIPSPPKYQFPFQCSQGADSNGKITVYHGTINGLNLNGYVPEFFGQDPLPDNTTTIGTGTQYVLIEWEVAAESIAYVVGEGEERYKLKHTLTFKKNPKIIISSSIPDQTPMTINEENGETEDGHYYSPIARYNNRKLQSPQYLIGPIYITICGTNSFALGAMPFIFDAN